MDALGIWTSVMAFSVCFAVGFAAGVTLKDYTIHQEVLLKRKCIHGSAR